jgi:hypothetical protein
MAAMVKPISGSPWLLSMPAIMAIMTGPPASRTVVEGLLVARCCWIFKVHGRILLRVKGISGHQAILGRILPFLIINQIANGSIGR